MRSRSVLLVLLLMALAAASIGTFFALSPSSSEVADLSDSSAPEEVDPKAPEAAALMNRADELAEKDQYAQAIALYEQVIRDYPETQDPSNEFGDPRFSATARQEIAYLKCRQRVPRDPAFDSPEALLAEVQKAFSSGDSGKVASLAACDFAIGRPQSDTGVSVNPIEVSPKMVELLKDAKWSGAKVDLPFRAIVVSGQDGTEFRLSLAEAELGRKWGWSAFTTMSENALKALAEAAGYR